MSIPRLVPTASPAPAAKYLAKSISTVLAERKRVLWLVSGGSSVDVATLARRQLTGNLANLIVMQVDERFGDPGHPDSNWQKLLTAGFDTNAITYYPMLTGKNLNDTTRDYDQALTEMLDNVDFSIGLFGIGADGHTAGILPGSPAASSKQLVASYQGPDFERITMTPVAMAQLDAAAVYATGEEKRAALEGLRSEKAVDEQPAQALKQIASVTIFNDVMEGNL